MSLLSRAWFWHALPCDQHGTLRATRRIVSTAGAAAWLPHSKLRDTHMMRV